MNRLGKILTLGLEKKRACFCRQMATGDRSGLHAVKRECTVCGDIAVRPRGE